MRAGFRLPPPVRYEPFYLDQQARPQPLDAFGIDALVGPKGSGKTLLAVHRARRYAQALVKRLDGGCACGVEDCSVSGWTVFTNIASTWIGDDRSRDFGGGWARPLDIAAQVVDSMPGQTHVVALYDEGYQLVDSRRSTTNAALEITDEITQARKAKVLTLLTGVSFDWFDRRIRAQARQVYNCWTPDRGRTVYAQVNLLSTGHLPPWQRANQPPRTMRWNTANSRRYYDTHERIDMRDELKSALADRTIMVRDEDGRLALEDVPALIDQIVYQKADSGAREIDPVQFAQELRERDIVMTPSQVSRHLSLKLGFAQLSSGCFLIRSDRSLEELTR